MGACEGSCACDWASVHTFEEDATPGPDSRRGKLSGATRVSVTVIDSADPENYIELHGRVSIFGAVYDSGDYAVALDRALAAAVYEDLRAEQAKRRVDGDVAQLGIGLPCYVEITGAGAESGNPSENATVEVHPDGSATILTGTSPHGQGHATVWAMLASDELGIPIDKITLKWGDTDLISEGGGTGG